MNEFIITKVNHLDTHKLMMLVDESRTEGFRHLKRLVSDYDTGTNKFDKDGEALFLALKNGDIVGVCGLNEDPHSENKEIGRVRRLYVLFYRSDFSERHNFYFRREQHGNFRRIFSEY